MWVCALYFTVRGELHVRHFEVQGAEDHHPLMAGLRPAAERRRITVFATAREFPARPEDLKIEPRLPVDWEGLLNQVDVSVRFRTEN